MSIKKGFTLIELLVVTVIIGILVAVAMPIYFSMAQTGAANAAEHNLIAIYNAQQSYFFANGSYCTGTGLPTDCGYSLATINTNLGNINGSTSSLNITDSYFTSYQCVMSAGTPQCTASGSSSNTSLTVKLNTPVVMPNPTDGSAANPSCTATNNNSCPTG